ncbi:oxidoreductase [Kordiimonas sediminis]|uniref:Oxidoreductase n=1 Tax=Kordiimonas sediminis TaxID=1735581 RepID=A0A919E8G2_9PROT|nr:flavin reductase family protein [Kordiimonas sediminis]GHF25056.1 oxidoreductase [Kordiimonas sediminis]
MPISAEDFKQGMRRLGGAVNIVTTSCDGVWYGLTATAVTSLTAEPPRLLCCVNRQGATYGAISKSRNLCVNVLSTEHKDLAMIFAGMSGESETERFTKGTWAAGSTGAPRLVGAMASFECTVESILDSGSHGIVIGSIEGLDTSGEEINDPLCYLDGAWATMTQV